MGDAFQKPEIKAARKRTKERPMIRDYVFDPRYLDLGKGRKYLIQTHGCQANEADTEHIEGILDQAGFISTQVVEEADLILVNTCAVRENAENKVFGEIGRLKQYTYNNPDLIIGICGCMSQEEVVVEKLMRVHPHVKLILGTHNFDRILDYIHKIDQSHKRVIEVFSTEGDIIERLPTQRKSHVKAWVNIMYGCDEFCTYCIVPYTRGKERSRPFDAIISEVETLIQMGYQEITLLGQNVNAYGLDLPEKGISFAFLLETLRQMPIPRIRFTTSHPKDFSREIVQVLGKGGNLMPAIHLPVQSGSDAILKRMNRKYTKDSYLRLVQDIYAHIPSVSLTTDIIVGFPGETEADFSETLDLVRQARFEGAYTFIYSPRSGTPAALFPDDILYEVKKERLYTLNHLVNEGFLRGNQRFVHHNVDVLVEGRSKSNQDKFTGYTPHNKLVNFASDQDIIGKIIPVQIIEAKTWSLIGVVDHESN
ncbi:MAG: tRNA (N6-isopentenyl adenosine(37)-C2)-methylthiotransferase MiaB [Candidatus Izemoplasmatales bacterium]|nr:tRNA (N6-isopentenyl adenosine(37)-C2)-methylthiotransferase MiaB [Candidatus Izemoplasmatales bacterium]